MAIRCCITAQAIDASIAVQQAKASIAQRAIGCVITIGQAISMPKYYGFGDDSYYGFDGTDYYGFYQMEYSI